jgi:hypothetical protein
MLAGPDRPKWALLTVFPLVYFRFVSNQNIVFARYLLPLLPFLSLLGAAAIVRFVGVARRTSLPRPAIAFLAVGLVVVAVAPPTYTAIAFNAMAAKVWTNEQAYEWIVQTLPRGSKVALESRGVLLPATYQARYYPQLRLHPLETYAADGVDYLIASSQCYGMFLEGGPQRFPVEYADYMRIFQQTEELARFTPSRDHPGPELRVLKIVRVTP